MGLQRGFATGGMGSDRHFARQQSCGPDPRFGSKADIGTRSWNVRFVRKADIERTTDCFEPFQHEPPRSFSAALGNGAACLVRR